MKTKSNTIELRQGDEIPEFDYPLSVQRLVMAAASVRDFAPIHHDREFAQSWGAPDMFVNTVFIQSLIEFTLRRWMGPAGRLRKLRYRMLTFNAPGDILRCGATVVEVTPHHDVDNVRLAVRVTSQRGHTVTGEAVVTLPRPSVVTPR